MADITIHRPGYDRDRRVYTFHMTATSVRGEVELRKHFVSYPPVLRCESRLELDGTIDEYIAIFEMQELIVEIL